jgi:hypothetical protein
VLFDVTGGVARVPLIVATDHVSADPAADPVSLSLVASKHHRAPYTTAQGRERRAALARVTVRGFDSQRSA